MPYARRERHKVGETKIHQFCQQFNMIDLIKRLANINSAKVYC